MHFKIDSRSGFSSTHMIKAIMLMEKPLGRNRLMKALNLNEASARTLLRTLEKNGLVVPTEKGHGLTKKGYKLFSEMKGKIHGPIKIKKSGITVSQYNIAYIARKCSSKIKTGIEQRDSAIVAGADGLTTLLYENGLKFPKSRVSKIPKSLENIFEFKNGDVLLIGSAKNELTAELAALGAAIELIS